MKNPFRNLGVTGKVALLICALEIFYICSVQIQNYDPQDPNRLFWLVIATPYQQIVASTVGLRNQSFVYGGMFLSISLILSVFFSRLLTQSLRKITFAVKHFGNTRVPQSLPVHSGDEVGFLARTFEEMFGKIQDSTKRLENEISERKEIEAALRESDEKFRQVIDHSADTKFIIGLNLNAEDLREQEDAA